MWIVAARLATLAIDGAQSCGRRIGPGELAMLWFASLTFGALLLWPYMKWLAPRLSPSAAAGWMPFVMLPGIPIAYLLGLALGWPDPGKILVFAPAWVVLTVFQSWQAVGRSRAGRAAPLSGVPPLSPGA